MHGTTDPVFVDVSSSFETGGPRSRSTWTAGAPPTSASPRLAIGRTIRTLLAGEKVGSFEEAGRRHDVRVQVLPEYRDDPAGST